MRIYLYIAALFAVLGSYYAAYHAGQVSERNKQTAAALAFKQHEDDLITQLADSEAKLELLTNARIAVVDKAVGACLDDRIPGDLLGSLRSDVPTR